MSANVFENMDMHDIRASDISQLLMYVESIEDKGEYLGNKKEFQERHQRIKKWVQDMHKIAYRPGVKMPWQQARNRNRKIKATQ